MKALTLGLFLAAWLPGGLLAAETATTERRLGGIFVERLYNASGTYTCTDYYINPAHVAFFIPSNGTVTDRTYHKPFAANCDQAASVEGIILSIHLRDGHDYESDDYLYNGTLDEFRREFWDAHP